MHAAARMQGELLAHNTVMIFSTFLFAGQPAFALPLLIGDFFILGI
jgi:hypothetical protein